jgi:hypothetical protein
MRIAWKRYCFDRRYRVEMKAGRIGHPRLHFIRATLDEQRRPLIALPTSIRNAWRLATYSMLRIPRGPSFAPRKSQIGGNTFKLTGGERHFGARADAAARK